MVHISLLFILTDGTTDAHCNVQTAEEAGKVLHEYLSGSTPSAGACVGWIGCSTQSRAFEVGKSPTMSEGDFVDHIKLLLGYHFGWTGSRFMTQSEHTVYKLFQDKLRKKKTKP